MAENNPNDLHDYAGGWITERKGTGVPTFLKFAYIVIAFSAAAYLYIFMNGEVNHSDRGALVRQFNEMTQSSPTFMYIVISMVLVYLVALVMFAFKAVSKDE